MSVGLMTNNPRKVAEYRRFLGRHAQTLLVERPTEAPEVLLRWLETARAVLADESNLFDPAGDLVRPGYVGPARNICRLHTWVLDEGRLVLGVDERLELLLEPEALAEVGLLDGHGGSGGRRLAGQRPAHGVPKLPRRETF